MSETLEYKKDFLNKVRLAAENDYSFEQEAFFEFASNLLSEAGILDNVEYSPFVNSSKGMKIDGYSWNELEKTLTGIILHFDGDDEINTLTMTQINKLSKRVENFISKLNDQLFLATLEESTDLIVAEDIADYLEQAFKYRIVILSDSILSSRVKKIDVNPIGDLPTACEVWDIERIRLLDNAATETEPFTVDLKELCGGLHALPANVDQDGAASYLCVIPGIVLSMLYDEYGQRLLEANVRTFLDFRSAVNNGIRRGLLVEPENFFSYNNGLTCTATAIKATGDENAVVIEALDNLQIVNGGQTTASIYFSPREKGGVSGYLYKDIDLSKVFVQMKLTVISDVEIQDVLKSKISQFANTQNSIQKSDLVSNHPFHLNIEKLSQTVPMPADESGLSTKWFYERARGQYGTKLRALNTARKKAFELEYPKSKKFSKADMAKYENTWRMKPYEVKKGNEANLKLLGAVIIDEYDKDESNFKHSFFKDLVSKMILFRETDMEIGRSDWYKENRGLKAETVTYTLAYFRHKLLEKSHDLNLERIFSNQHLSKSMIEQILYLAKEIRSKIQDDSFRGGISNPSEFCKSKKGWDLIKELSLKLDFLDSRDILNLSEQRETKKEKQELDNAGAQIESQAGIMDITAKEWNEIASFFQSNGYPLTHKNISIPRMCANMFQGGAFPSDKQSSMALSIRRQAYSEGFDYID
jgi:hypothetical protein